MKEYYRHLLSSHFERDAIKEIDNLLTEELAKSEQIRDYDKIDELTDIYSFLAGTNEQIDKTTELGINSMLSNLTSLQT